MSEGLDRFGDLFTALGDGTRRRILDLLATRGEATATMLAEDVPVSRQAVVKHLAVLEGAELVGGRRQGREVRYAVRTGRLATGAASLYRVAADWERRRTAIKRAAGRRG